MRSLREPSTDIGDDATSWTQKNNPQVTCPMVLLLWYWVFGIDSANGDTRGSPRRSRKRKRRRTRKAARKRRNKRSLFPDGCRQAWLSVRFREISQTTSTSRETQIAHKRPKTQHTEPGFRVFRSGKLRTNRPRVIQPRIPPRLNRQLPCPSLLFATILPTPPAGTTCTCPAALGGPGRATPWYQSALFQSWASHPGRAGTWESSLSRPAGRCLPLG